MSIIEWLKNAERRLEVSGCPDPQIDARWIAEDTLLMNRMELRFEGARELDERERHRLDALLERREKGEPVQYVLRHTAFMELDFYVDERVLIPRQDTETLVEAALNELKARPHAQVLDLCTGSGCIGLSLKALSRSVEVTITDLSEDALAVARMNADLLHLFVRIEQGDLFDAVSDERYDVIVSNPPYIPKGDLAELQREVLREPLTALDGGLDGLDIYRRIAAQAFEHLKPGGCIFLEIGVGESAAVCALFENAGKGAQCSVIKDLNGIERVVVVRTNR